MNKYYKFKNVKHSVIMKLLKRHENGLCELENKDYPHLYYEASIDELEEVE